MEALVDHGATSKPNGMPTVKMGGIKHRVLCQQQERLNLRHVSRLECPVGMGQRTANELDSVPVMFVLPPPALRHRPNGENQPE
jgi:hypothetical protein